MNTINITASGTVQNDVAENRFAKIKVQTIGSYIKNGERVTSERTYYVAIWFTSPVNLKAGTEITVTGVDAYRLSQPKEDGRVFIDRVIADAELVPGETITYEDVPF